MKLDLRALIASDISELPISYELSPELDTSDQRSSLYNVRFPTKMTVSGLITNNAGYMRLSLSLAIDYIAPCARCLCDVNGRFEYSLEKTVALASVISTLDENKRDEYVIVEDGFLDIDEQLLELFELEFPTKILCKEDCKGLCPKCGQDKNQGECNCEMREIDPRLLPLQKLLEEMKNDKK